MTVNTKFNKPKNQKNNALFFLIAVYYIIRTVIYEIIKYFVDTTLLFMNIALEFDSKHQTIQTDAYRTLRDLRLQSENHSVRSLYPNLTLAYYSSIQTN